VALATSDTLSKPAAILSKAGSAPETILSLNSFVAVVSYSSSSAVVLPSTPSIATPSASAACLLSAKAVFWLLML
jgi:hypothetical protein